MIYFFEGMDNCLKDTIIGELRSKLSPCTHILKYSNPPQNIENAKEYQMKHFRDMFDLILLILMQGPDRNLILNRSHLGEFVYGPIYRQYNADWIFELEQDFFTSPDSATYCLLILLYDSSNENLLAREDGKSFSEGKAVKLDHERKRFLEGYQKSLFKHKVSFDLANYCDENKRIDTSKIVESILLS